MCRYPKGAFQQDVVEKEGDCKSAMEQGIKVIEAALQSVI